MGQSVGTSGRRDCDNMITLFSHISQSQEERRSETSFSPQLRYYCSKSVVTF